MEDSYIIFAKRFQIVKNRILMHLLVMFIIIYDFMIMFITTIALICKSFALNEMVISDLSMIATFCLLL